MTAMLLAVWLAIFPALSGVRGAGAMDCCATAATCADCSCALGMERNPAAATTPPVASPVAREDGRAAEIVLAWILPPPQPVACPNVILAARPGGAPPLFLQTQAFLI